MYAIIVIVFTIDSVIVFRQTHFASKEAKSENMKSVLVLYLICSTRAVCTDGWSEYEFASVKRCFKIIGEVRPFDNDSTCSSHGGTVAVPRNNDENNQLFDIYRLLTNTTEPRVWLGIERYDSCDDLWYQQKTNRKIEWTKWANGEPTSLNEKCARGFLKWRGKIQAPDTLICVNENDAVSGTELNCEDAVVEAVCNADGIHLSINDCFNVNVDSQSPSSSNICQAPENCGTFDHQLDGQW